MNSADLHLWILDHVCPMVESACVAMGELAGSRDEDEQHRFWTYAGEHQAVSAVVRALLELVAEMRDDEAAERRRREPVFDD